jgi:hypothetical protein
MTANPSTLHTRGTKPEPGSRAGLTDCVAKLTARYLWDGAWRRVRITQAFPGSMGGVTLGELAELAWLDRAA